MTKPLYILFAILLVSCSKQESCSTETTEHQLDSIRISLTSCYHVYYPDSTKDNLIWIVKNDTLKFKLELNKFIALSLDSLDPEENYKIETDTIDQNFLLTTAVRKNYKRSYKKEQKENDYYDFTDQPFWFEVRDLNKSFTWDTTFIKTSDSSFIPLVDFEHNGVLIGTTTDMFKIFRPRPNEIEDLIKNLKKIKIK